MISILLEKYATCDVESTTHVPLFKKTETFYLYRKFIISNLNEDVVSLMMNNILTNYIQSLSNKENINFFYKYFYKKDLCRHNLFIATNVTTTNTNVYNEKYEKIDDYSLLVQRFVDIKNNYNKNTILQFYYSKLSHILSINMLHSNFDIYSKLYKALASYSTILDYINYDNISYEIVESTYLKYCQQYLKSLPPIIIGDVNGKSFQELERRYINLMASIPNLDKEASRKGIIFHNYY